MRELGTARDNFERINKLLAYIKELEASNDRLTAEIAEMTAINDRQASKTIAWRANRRSHGDLSMAKT